MATSIRDAAPADLTAITAIYAHAVHHGTASFELSPPDEAEMARRREVLIAGGYPYIVALRDDRIAGYAYASAYRPRPAYRFTVEDSVYVDPAFQGQGVGRALLTALIEICEARGFRRMIAVIGDTQSHGSIALHRALGFAHIGTIPALGYKHDAWRDTVLMHRPLSEGDTTPPA
ncbi:MAG: N-acetyltransferase [Salinarimonas sp.]|nr:N-acetyltransferase [Salinarimonas sp.]